MLETEAVEALLHVASEDEVRDNRLAAIETLTYLPLSASAWRALASVAAEFVSSLPVSDPESEHAIRVCARIPVRSVRELLGAIARDPGHPSSLPCAIELARCGDASGLQRLLAELETANAEQVVERLACLPLERLQVTHEPFAKALSAGSPGVRFWAALALARLGEMEPLEQVWDALLAEGAEPPPLFGGNPWTPYHALEAARPLPAQLHSFLVGLHGHELTRVREQRGPEARLSRDANLLIGGLTGLIDVYGEPQAEGGTAPAPLREPADPTVVEAVVQRLLDRPFDEHLAINVDWEQRQALARLDPERAGELMTAALDALEEKAKASGVEPSPMDDAFLGNAMVYFACAMPEPMRLPLGEVVEIRGQRWSHLPSRPLTWVLSRAGADAVVTEFGPRIAAADASQRRHWLSWVGMIARQLNASAPIGGAGPSAGEVPLSAEAVIDDFAGAAEPVGWAGAAPVELPAEAAEPPGVPPGPAEVGKVSALPKTRALRSKGKHEMPDAGVTAAPRRSLEPSREEEALRQTPRYIQTRVSRFEGAQSIHEPPVWIAGARHVLRVRLGPIEEGWTAPKSPSSSFPYALLPPAKKHRLRVILSEPNHLGAPVGKTITIQQSGPSDVAEFPITPRADCKSFRARIAIAHRNRILQTALLSGRVVAQAGDAEPRDRIEMEIEAVVCQMHQDLEGRARSDVAMALSQTPEGEPHLFALADERAVVRGFGEDVKARIDAISQCLSVVANDAMTYADGLRGEAGVRILRFLADNGRALYDFLIRDQQVGPRFKDGPNLQIVNLTPDAVFPAEFIYDFATPAEDARLCDAAREAFTNLDFHRICRGEDHQTANHPMVCPFGFWGLRRVIERHACLPKGHEQVAGDFVLQAERTEIRKSIELEGSAILGVSAQVEKEHSGATAALLAGLQASSRIPVTMVPKWQGWASQVESLRPSLIVTLPHAEEKSQFGVSDYFLEIGGELQKARVIGEPAAHYVLARDDAPAPVVLLLGCNTSTPKTPIESIVGHFRRGGAAIVVGTVGSVLGSHASIVAAELVRALFEEAAKEPRPLGELLRDVRRRCVGRDVLMALCVAAFGDADWQIHAA